MTKQQALQFQAGFIQWVKNAAGFVTAIGVVLALGWFLVEPRIEEWLETRERPVMDRLQEIEASLSIIQKQLSGQKVEIIDFKGVGLVPNTGPYKPGETVSIVYQLRRNLPCALTVQAGFLEGRSGDIDTSLTYEFPGTREPVSQEFSTFVVRVKIPDEIRPGNWSYAPLLSPKSDCNGVNALRPPISQFFQVEN